MNLPELYRFYLDKKNEIKEAKKELKNMYKTSDALAGCMDDLKATKEVWTTAKERYHEDNQQAGTLAQSISDLKIELQNTKDLLNIEAVAGLKLKFNADQLTLPLSDNMSLSFVPLLQ